MFDALGRGGSKKKFGSEDRSLPIGEKRPAKLRRARAIAETPSVNSLGPRMIRLRYVLGNAGSLRQTKMELHAAKLESKENVVDDSRESAKITSRARSRIAELLQKPFDVRSISLTGLFILALFYTMYFMRSVLLPIVLAVLLSYLLRPIVRALARAKIPTLLGAVPIDWLRDFCSCRTYGRLVSEGADGFAGAAAQIYASEEIDGQGCAG